MYLTVSEQLLHRAGFVLSVRSTCSKGRAPSTGSDWSLQWDCGSILPGWGPLSFPYNLQGPVVQNQKTGLGSIWYPIRSGNQIQALIWIKSSERVVHTGFGSVWSQKTGLSWSHQRGGFPVDYQSKMYCTIYLKICFKINKMVKFVNWYNQPSLTAFCVIVTKYNTHG